MIENRFVTSESSFVDMATWDRCVQPAWRPVIDRQVNVVLGRRRCQLKHDCTAIVGVTFDRKSKQVRQLCASRLSANTRSTTGFRGAD